VVVAGRSSSGPGSLLQAEGFQESGMEAVPRNLRMHRLSGSLHDHVGSTQRRRASTGVWRHNRHPVQDLHPTLPTGHVILHGEALYMVLHTCCHDRDCIPALSAQGAGVTSLS